MWGGGVGWRDIRAQKHALYLSLVLGSKGQWLCGGMGRGEGEVWAMDTGLGLKVGGGSMGFDAPEKAGSGCFWPRVGGLCRWRFLWVTGLAFIVSL